MNEKEENTNMNTEKTGDVWTPIRDPAVNGILEATSDVMRRMREPMVMLATSNGNEDMIGNAINAITGLAFELAKKSFAIGMEAGASMAKEHFVAALDTIEKRFFERTGMVQP